MCAATSPTRPREPFSGWHEIFSERILNRPSQLGKKGRGGTYHGERRALFFSSPYRGTIPNLLTNDNEQEYSPSVKPLRVVKPNPRDPSWKFPYASREKIDELRQYFAAFANRLEGWKQNKHTHALPEKDRRPDIPFYSVPEQHRAEAIRWFNMKIDELKKSGRPITQGKINSLRMNATNYGRYVLTRKRSINRMQYERRKRIWLTFLEWDAKQQGKEIEVNKPYTPSKQLEI